MNRNTLYDLGLVVLVLVPVAVTLLVMLLGLVTPAGVAP